MNPSSVDKSTEKGQMPSVGCGGGLGADAPMGFERKCLVLVGAACIMLIIVCAVAIGFAIHPVAGLFALMLCAAWIGEAVASTLKKNRARVGSTGGSAPSYDVFYGNNDYDTTGSTPAEALSEISFELETDMSAVLLLRHGMTKAEALKAVDDLRWLVEKSDLPNADAEPQPRR